jgi:hypothetical protein
MLAASEARRAGEGHRSEDRRPGRRRGRTLRLPPARRRRRKPRIARDLIRGDRGELPPHGRGAEIFVERLKSTEARTAFEAFMTKAWLTLPPCRST